MFSLISNSNNNNKQNRRQPNMAQNHHTELLLLLHSITSTQCPKCIALHFSHCRFDESYGLISGSHMVLSAMN